MSAAERRSVSVTVGHLAPRRAPAIAGPGGAVPPVSGATWTLREASLATRLHQPWIRHLCRRGLVDAVEVDLRWLIDARSLLARLTSPPKRLPADPMLQLVWARGGAAGCGVAHDSAEKWIERATVSGFVTHRSADRYCVRVLGVLPVEIWGSAAEF